MSKFYYGTEEYARFELAKAKFFAEAVDEKVKNALKERISTGDKITSNELDFFSEVLNDSKDMIELAERDLEKYNHTVEEKEDA